MEDEVKTPRYVQMWLPGFEPEKTEQPLLPGFPDEDMIEPSEGDLAESR